jgi:hypothetical protein
MERGGNARLWLLWMATAPSSWLLLFASFAVRARLALGRWPLPYRPDPKDLGFSLHYLAVLLGFPLALWLCIGALVMARAWGAIPVRSALMIRIAAVLSAGSTIAVARLDPWQLVVWFLD